MRPNSLNPLYPVFSHAENFPNEGVPVGGRENRRKIRATNYIRSFPICKKHIKNVENLDDIKEKIRAAMEVQGTYTPELDLCIELCAGSFMAFKIALADISKKRMKSFVKETSREGNTKLVAHPSFKVLFDSLEATRKQLRELGLTLQTLASGEADEVTDLINEVTEADDE